MKNYFVIKLWERKFKIKCWKSSFILCGIKCVFLKKCSNKLLMFFFICRYDCSVLGISGKYVGFRFKFWFF